MSRPVALHCDNTCPPYRIDDFRQPLKDFGVIQEVGGIGAYQMSHVWLVNFRSDDVKEKLLEAERLDVKGRTVACDLNVIARASTHPSDNAP